MAHITFSDDEIVALLNDPYIFQNDSLVYFLNLFNLFEITLTFSMGPHNLIDDPLSLCFVMNPYMFRFPLII